METNNKYYKVIAQLIDENIDNQHHTDLYYAKKIAESYDNSYSDVPTVNKCLRDFAEDLGVELDKKHHTTLYYLKKIAEKVYDKELEYNTMNYYLRIISENFSVTPSLVRPSTFNLRITNDGTPIANKKIYDANNQSIEYYTDVNGEVKDIALPTKANYGDFGDINYANALSGTGVDTWNYKSIRFIMEDGEYTKFNTGFLAYLDIPYEAYTIELTVKNKAVEIKIV